jgi:hypothetical protein
MKFVSYLCVNTARIELLPIYEHLISFIEISFSCRYTFIAVNETC